MGHMPGAIVLNSSAALLVNANASAVVFGTPVYSSATGAFDKALGDGSAKAVLLGLVVDNSIATGIAGYVQTTGAVDAPTYQWDAVCGTSGGLTKGVTYYLSATVAGTLTTATTSGVKVFTALSTTQAFFAVNVTLPTTGVTPGAYTNANITVSSTGVISLASNGAGGGGGITNTAGANVVTKSNGTNVIASGVTDDGTTVAVDAERLRIKSLNGIQTAAVTLAAGLTSNWDPFAGGAPTMFVVVTPDPTDSIIDGMLADSGASPAHGAIRIIIHSAINHGRLIVKNDEGSASSVGNHIRIHSDSNIANSGFAIGHRQCAIFVYNQASGYWQVIAGPDGAVRKFTFVGDITDVALGLNVNDYSPTGIQYTTVLRLAPTSTCNLSGLLGQSHGDIRVLTAFSAGITLLHNSSTPPANASIAGNRFYLPGSANLVMPAFSSVVLRYDGPNTAWVVQSKSA